MQTAGNLVAVVIKLAAGMQYGHDHFGGGDPFFWVDIDWNAAPIILNGNRLVRVNGNGDFVTVPGQGFVNRVVNDFKHHVVQAGTIVSVTNVHARTLADGVQPFEYLDVTGIIGDIFAHSVTPDFLMWPCSTWNMLTGVSLCQS